MLLNHNWIEISNQHENGVTSSKLFWLSLYANSFLPILVKIGKSQP